MQKKRGRKSVAELATPTAISERRPEPPGDLPEAAQRLWRAVAGTKPADWFRADTHELLRAYCLHCTRARMLDEQVDAMRPQWLNETEGLKRMDTLLRMRERETKAALSLARAMRLTQQAQVHPVTAGRAHDAATADKPKPWD